MKNKYLIVINDRSYCSFETLEIALGAFETYEKYYDFKTLELVEIKKVKVWHKRRKGLHSDEKAV
jgi:hypothetical protein